MTSCKCHKLHEGYLSVQGRFCVDSNSEKSDPKQPSEGCVIPSGRSSVSNIVRTIELFVRMPRNVLQITIEDVRTSEQHRPDTWSINIQQGVCFQKSTLFGKSLQAVWTTWQNVRTMSSSSQYSRVPFEHGKDLVKTVWT
jgi:ABC-type transporter Mla maintaining outer membrane lipid asymmetry ATPase subunit MlaF